MLFFTTLVGMVPQAGRLQIGSSVVRVEAIGGFGQNAVGGWDAAGNPLSPQDVRKIKGPPSSLDFGSEDLRNKSDLGRFVVIQVVNPSGWLLKPDLQDRTYLGSQFRSKNKILLYLSLPKGTVTFDIPVAALHQGQGKLLFEFGADGANEYGGAALSVRSRDASMVSYTKREKRIIEKRIPMTETVVVINAPRSWSERFLDLEAPGAIWPKSAKDHDPMGPEKMHGVIEEHAVGKDRSEITLSILTPGPPNKNLRLRLVERELLHGAIKNLPALPR